MFALDVSLAGTNGSTTAYRAEKSIGMNKPNHRLREVIDDYVNDQGLPTVVIAHFVPVDVPLAQEIASCYENALDTLEDMRTIAAYQKLTQELGLQYAYLLEYGYVLEPWLQQGQPYRNSAEMCSDVQDNNHLWFFTGGEPNPLLNEPSGYTYRDRALTNTDVFRAVHDCFGHAAEGYEFGVRGEENAWVHHSMTFRNLAQRALSTETRGQNSWVNFGPYAHLTVTKRPYAKQKAFLLPTTLTNWREALVR